MEQGLFGEVNLFADQEEENEKYINAIEAIELIKFKTGNHIPNVCRFLLLKGFNFTIPTHIKDYLGRIFNRDNRINDVPFEDWSTTSDLLNKGLENFECNEADYSRMYEKSDYECYYWIKSDFFNFGAIQELNITPHDYADFLAFKVTLWASKQKKDTFIEEMEKLDEDELQVKNKIIPLLYKKPLLTLHEAACIMTRYDPQYVEQCQNDTNFKQNFSNYLEAYDYICTCIDAQMLSYDSYTNRLHFIDFKKFLANENTFIDGFNDELKDSELSKKDQNSDANNSTIEQLKKENEKLKAELLERDKKIKELELLELKEDTDLLSLIFDESVTERYAPDLANSIKLWKCLYIENKVTEDKHSNRANHWILKNTPYKETASVEVKRLREITSPFNSWHVDRKNKFNK